MFLTRRFIMRLVFNIVFWSWFLLFFACGKKDGPSLNLPTSPTVLTDTLVTEEHLASGEALFEVRPGDEISVTLERRDRTAKFSLQNKRESIPAPDHSRYSGSRKCWQRWRRYDGQHIVKVMPGENLESLPVKVKIGGHTYPFARLDLVSAEEKIQRALFWVEHHHLQSGNEFSLVVEQPPLRYVRVGFLGFIGCRGWENFRINTNYHEHEVQDRANFEMQLIVRGMP